MSEWIDEYVDYEAFAKEWHADDLSERGVTLEQARDRGLINEQETRHLWQLLGLLSDDELFVHIPAWLAEEKIGDTDRNVSTTFVGRLARETEKAILLEDSATTTALLRLAHQIHSLEHGIETTQDPDRREGLDRRLQKKRKKFDRRDDSPVLSDEWLPKSQLINAVQRNNETDDR